MSKVTSCRSKQNQHSATSGTGFSESAHRGRSAFKISTYQRSWCKHRHQTAALCKVSRSVVFLCSDSARASWQITTSEWMRDSMLETMVRQLGIRDEYCPVFGANEDVRTLAPECNWILRSVRVHERYEIRLLPRVHRCHCHNAGGVCQCARWSDNAGCAGSRNISVRSC